MRNTIIALLVAITVGLGYAVWPFVDLYGLVQAVRARNVAEIGTRVDFKEIRRSLTGQLGRAYLHLTGKDKNLNSFTQAFAIGAITTVADPIVAKMVTPEALADLLQNGWPAGLPVERPVEFKGISTE